jgi:hypothetical protein
VETRFGILVNYAGWSDGLQAPPVSESINSAGSTAKASASFLLVLGLAGRLFASRSAMVARATPAFLARSSWESAARSLNSRNRGVFSKFPSSRVWGFGHYRALALHLQARYETILVHTGMAPRRDRQVSPEARPTELGGSLWTPQSLAHPMRTHLLRIPTTLLRRITPALSAPTPATRASSTSVIWSSVTTAKRSRSSRPFRVGDARIVDSPAPIAYAGAPSEGTAG